MLELGVSENGVIFFSTIFKKEGKDPERILVLKENLVGGTTGRRTLEGLKEVFGCQNCDLGNLNLRLLAPFFLSEKRRTGKIISYIKCLFFDGVNPNDVNAPPCFRNNKVK